MGSVVSYLLGAALVAGCWAIVFGNGLPGASQTSLPPAAIASRIQPALPPKPSPEQLAVAAAALDQSRRPVVYDSSYRSIRYPMGDVPKDTGVSTDVVVRSLRAMQFDLQVEIHEDRTANPKHYPLHRWANKRPDAHIDHRRIANVCAYLSQHAAVIPTHSIPRNLDAFLPGDIVAWSLEGNGETDHIGVVSGQRSSEGVPLVVDLHPESGRIHADHRVNEWIVRAHYRVEPSLLTQ